MSLLKEDLETLTPDQRNMVISVENMEHDEPEDTGNKAYYLMILFGVGALFALECYLNST